MSIHIKPPATSGGGGLPRHVAGNIGLDPNAPGMQKASQYWDMLDDLHKSDPEAYQQLIDEQLRAGRKKTRTRQFRPQAGFVVKTFCFTAATGRRKLFLNVAGFDGVEPPTSSNGTVLGDDAHGYQARSIPLLVSPLREAKLKKNSSEVATCVDVVFNPWVVRKCEHEAAFKQQVIRLAMRWVQDETELTLSIADARVINSVYKGGGGANLRDPVAFPITLSEEEMRELYPDGVPSAAPSSQQPRPPNGGGGGSNPAVMQSPSDLLRAFKVGAAGADDDESTADAPRMPGSSSAWSSQAAAAGTTTAPKSALDDLLNLNPQPGPRQHGEPTAAAASRQRQLQPQQRHSGIRDVGARSASSSSSSAASSSSASASGTTSSRHPGIRVVEPTNSSSGTKKTKKGNGKSKTAVKKGFIFRQKKKGKATPLYPEGSSEHKPENPYPWANVVDLGSSDQDNVRKQMEQYAATGNVDNPTFRAKKPEPRRYAEWDPRAQQQQQEEEEEEARRMQKQQQAAQAQRVRDTKAKATLSAEEEKELDKLMAAADSGFGSIGLSEGDGGGASEGAEFYETLKSAMQMMGSDAVGGAGMSGAAAADVLNDPNSMQQFAEMTKHIMSSQGAGATPTQAAESDASALAAKLKGWAGSSKSASKESVTAKFKLSTVNDKKTGAACQKVVIQLPDVQSMGDVDLQLSSSELKLVAKTSGGVRRRLRVALCRNVDPATCKARFKKGKLTVTVRHR